MKKQSIFLGGIFFVSVLFLPGILDLTLAPRFVVLAVMLVALLIGVKANESYNMVRPGLVFSSYSLFVLVCLASIAWSNTRSEAWFSAERALLGLAVFLVVVHYMQSNGVAFLQALCKLSVTIFFCGFFIALIQLVKLPSYGKENMYAVTGLYSHKNLYASFLFLQLVFIIAGQKILAGKWRIAALISLVLGVSVLLMLRTRAVYIGALIVTLVYFVTRFAPIQKLATWKSRLVVTLILVLLANIFFLYLLPHLIQWQLNGRLPEGSLLADRERLVVWDKTYQILDKNKWFGCGAGNWQFIFPSATLSNMWRVEDMNVTFQRPHNDFLWILSETGIAGLNLFLFFFLSLLIESCVAVKKTALAKASGLWPAFFPAFMAGYFAISFFDFPAERAEHVSWINIIAGISFAFVAQQLPEQKMYTPLKAAFFRPILIAGFLFVTVTGLLRIRGEFYTKIMYEQRVAGNFRMVINAAQNAASFSYCTDPTSVPLTWYSGNARAATGDYAGALSDFETARKQAPFNRNVLNDLASAYSLMKRNDAAIPLYEEAARISPRFDDPKLNLVAIYLNAADYKKARYWLNLLLHDSERRTRYENLLRVKEATGSP